MKDIHGNYLYLTATAEAAARILADLGAQFTSGHRDLRQQAHAMAVNVALQRDWVGVTYAHGSQVQAWIDGNPEVVTIPDLAEGIYRVIAALPPGQQISHHLLMPCPCFDVQPRQDKIGVLILQTIPTLEGLTKFLEKEGHLTRWHCEFLAPAPL
jgi:hypothetical protein